MGWNMSDLDARTVTIGGKAYDLSDLSDLAKKHIASLRVVDQKIGEAEQAIGIRQTARAAYARVLKSELDKASKH